MRTAGFVLVGGRSSRMGRDKALLPWRSRPLVEHVAHSVRAATGSVTLVGEPQRYGFLNFDQLPDLHPGLGPLAGIEAALTAGRAELNLIVACDTPAMEADYLRRLVEVAAVHPATCVICEDPRGRLYPLCAVYKTACLPIVANAVLKRRLRLFDLVAELQAARLKIGCEIANVNTPEEWRRWDGPSQSHTEYGR